MSNSRINQWVVVLFSLIVFAGFGWWFWANFQEVEYTTHTEMAPEARRNPLLAAQRLLSRLGHRAESRTGRQFLIHPPAESGVLLVRDLGAPLPQARVDDLLAWVAAGGHLIASPGRLQDETLYRPLLQHFGVDFVRKGDLEGLEWLGAETEETKPASILLPGDEEEPFSVAFNPDAWFDVDYSESYWASPVGDQPHLLIFPVGAGYVTFLSDSACFDNLRLGDHDHAPLLAELSAGYDRVWLLYSAQMPSLVQLLWRWAPYLVVSLGLLCLLLIWRMSRRSGPWILTTQDQRRDLLEHLQATAEFTWRIDRAGGLLPLVRKQIEKRWLISHPQLQRLAASERCAWLAERTGMSVEAIDLALYRQQTHTDGGQLVKITANLQRLLAALHPQSNKR